TLYDTDYVGKFGNLRCRLRGSGADHPSTYQINGRFYTRPNLSTGDFTWVETLADDLYTVYALDATNARIATGSKDAVISPGRIRTGTFSPPANVGISRIEVAMNASQQLNSLYIAANGNFDRMTAVSDSHFFRLTNGGVYGYVLWTKLTDALPYGWWYQCDYVGLRFYYQNMPADTYYSIHQKTEYGLGMTLETPTWEVFNEGGYYPVPQELVTPISVGGQLVSDTTGYGKLKATSGARYVATQLNFRAFSNTPDVARQIFIKHEVWLTPVAASRIDFDNVLLWNVCPPEAL
ncbi:MAG TPA: hypothetical protein VFF78_03355, partial [Anaerolineaceae bacterium]|nr:hypothetical protein [Anaerolineaceae bacterium]